MNQRGNDLKQMHSIACQSRIVWKLVAVSLALLVVCGVHSQASAQEPRQLTVAAASSVRFAMDEMVRVFKQENRGIQVRVTYGSSGNFFAQLSQQAPFDIFLSADTVFPRRLVDQGDVLKESEFLYAVGRIVVWARANSPVQVETLGVRSLLDPLVKKIAIANPRHAPYGRAAVEALKSLGVYGQAREKLVLGENVAQAAQFVQSGVADIGILAMSLVMAPAIQQQGRLWQVPPAAYANIDQAGVILRWTLEREAAERFRDFMFGPKARAILRRYGFFLPGE